MNNLEPIQSAQTDTLALKESLSALAPVPTDLAETGLSEHFLSDLISKHYLNAGALSIKELSERLGLPGTVVENVVQLLKAEARVEVRPTQQDAGIRSALTEKGSRMAQEAFSRASYCGPAPITLEQYRTLVAAQSVHAREITRENIDALFAGTVINPQLLDQLGPALNSGRAIFIYGHAGTGKTYITRKLSGAFADQCLIPYSILVNDNVVPVFDPSLHQVHETAEKSVDLLYTDRFDARLVSCRRPVIVSGGELTLDMLDIRQDPQTGEFHAPLQLKANNGMFVIDDMGRQQATPMEVFNRWIVPLEERIDYLTLGAGRHFEVPFDQVLIFSSNINPLSLADEAFLRRIGYKIHFKTPTVEEFREIWDAELIKHGLSAEPEVFDHLVRDCYGVEKRVILPCHPRDLLGIARDALIYDSKPPTVGQDIIDAAWQNYFVELNDSA